MSKDFHEKLRKNPDSFDDQDCRPGPSAYPEANRDAVTPPHVKKLLAEKTAKAKKGSSKSAD